MGRCRSLLREDVERDDQRRPVLGLLREALREGLVRGIKDAGGFPAPLAADGIRAMPFWSLKSRVDRIIETVPDYAGFEPVEIPLAVWRTLWLPDLSDKGARIGLNWAGSAPPAMTSS